MLNLFPSLAAQPPRPLAWWYRTMFRPNSGRSFPPAPTRRTMRQRLPATLHGSGTVKWRCRKPLVTQTAMKSSRSSRVTQLLEKFEPGDRHADRAVVCGRLRRTASACRAILAPGTKDHTLQPTALVHEAYLKLVGQTRVDWQGRAHFLAIAAQAMRQILVDHARRHRAAKRGGNRHRIALDDNLVSESNRDVDLLALEDALTKLAKLDPRQAQMIELRFFGGLNIAEVAKVMGISKRSVEREWTMVRAWLRRELSRSDLP